MAYLHPGVYVEEIPSGAKPIESVGTSTAAFIGYTVKGPIGAPRLIFKWDDYVQEYGGLRDTGAEELGDPMGHGVFAYFQNGGSAAYIVRLAKDAVAAGGYMDHPEPGNMTDGLVFTAVNEGVWANGLEVRVDATEADASLYTVAIGRLDSKGQFKAIEQHAPVSMASSHPRFIESVINGVSALVTVEVKTLEEIDIPDDYKLGTSTSGELDPADAGFDLTAADDAARTLRVALDGTSAIDVVIPADDYTSNLAALATQVQLAVRTGSTAERRANFTCTYDGDAAILTLTSGTRTDDSSVAVDNSGLAPLLKLGAANGGTERTGSDTVNILVSDVQTRLVGGGDGDEPDDNDYSDVFTAFVKHRDINTICLPGKYWAESDGGNAVISAAIAHAEHMTSRMVLVDPDPEAELVTAADVSDLSLPTSTYSVSYYPWLRVANPYFNAETNPGVPRTVLVAPSGFAAGMWAKIDGRRGVWKAPAGVETGLLGAAGTRFTVEDGEQDQLNPLGINCLRKLPAFGPVIWGSRTLSTNANPEWRYVPVRRTAIMIEQSIYNGIQWAVFEPNDHRLWSGLRVNIDSFMNGLFRAGAFQGEKASDAYFVRCGLGDTMTQGDIDRGQVIVIVGFAPLKPAEFVIVRIQQKVGQQ